MLASGYPPLRFGLVLNLRIISCRFHMDPPYAPVLPGNSAALVCEQSGVTELNGVRWALAALLLLFGAIGVVGNVVIAARYLLFKKRESLSPIVGGVALALGVLLLPPVPPGWRWLLAGAALLVDLSVLELPLVLILYTVPRLRRRCLESSGADPAQSESANGNEESPEK